MMIKCTRCLTKLSTSHFSVNINSPTGYNSRCANCIRDRNREPDMFPKVIYLPVKNYIKYDEFISWLSHTKYKKLYKKWVKSNYKETLKPTIIKKDRDFDYSLTNIEIVVLKKRTKNTIQGSLTRHGVASRIYLDEVKSSKRRNHKPPQYTRVELRDWIFNQDNFETLYQAWVKSGYDSNLKPSVDRLDDAKGYSFDNIQLITWSENHKKNVESLGNKLSKPIAQYEITGRLVKEFKSITEASKHTGIAHGTISNAINPKRLNTERAGGYKWILL